MRLLHKPVGLMTDRLLFYHPIAHLSAHFILQQGGMSHEEAEILS